jgi:trehalose 2-sulfotransferase
MACFDSYVICTSPRSGSTLLCKMLAATGVAGNPASYFYDPSVEEWRADMGVEMPESATEREILDAVFRAVKERGRNGTGLFGLRQQAHGLAFLCEKMAVLYPQGATDSDRFKQAFGKTLFVHLTRPDKIDQAVSYLKAKQTGLWHSAPDGSELERTAPHCEPTYNGEALRECVKTMIAYDHDWNNWFLHEGIEPLHISYDDLADDPVKTLRHILGRLGLDQIAADGITPGVRKLADETSREWVARFQVERHPN